VKGFVKSGVLGLAVIATMGGCRAIDNYLNKAVKKGRVPLPIQQGVCDFFCSNRIYAGILDWDA